MGTSTSTRSPRAPSRHRPSGQTCPRVAAALPVALAFPLVTGSGLHRDQVAKVLAGPVRQVSDQVDRVAHTQGREAPRGQPGGAVSAQGDTVTHDLAPVIAAVKARRLARASPWPTTSRSSTVTSFLAQVRDYHLRQAPGLLPLLDAPSACGVRSPALVPPSSGGARDGEGPSNRQCSGPAFRWSRASASSGSDPGRMSYVNTTPAERD